MADLAVLVLLAGLVGAAGVALGILLARWLGAWDDRRAAAADPPSRGRESGSAPDADPPRDGGDTGD